MRRFVLSLLSTRVSGGTPRGGSCLGKDLKTLVPDVFGGVDVGVGVVSAAQALENCLADPVAGVNVPAFGTTLVGVVGGYRDKLPAVPIRLVFKLLAGSVLALGEDRTVQSRLLLHVLPCCSTVPLAGRVMFAVFVYSMQMI